MTAHPQTSIQPIENQSPETLLDWLHDNPQSSQFNIGDARYKVTGPVPTERAEKPFTIALTVDGAEAWLEVPAQLAESICAEQQQDIPLADVPDAYRGLFFEAILSDLLTRIEIESSAKIILNHTYSTTTAIAAVRVFSNRSQPNLHIFGFEVQAEDGTVHPVGLKINTASLTSLCRLLA